MESLSEGIVQHAESWPGPRACRPEGGAMSIERRFDVPLLGGMALREKQIQQSYRPIIGVHKWFAKRSGTLFRGLILAVPSEAFRERPDRASLRHLQLRARQVVVVPSSRKLKIVSLW